MLGGDIHVVMATSRYVWGMSIVKLKQGSGMFPAKKDRGSPSSSSICGHSSDMECYPTIIAAVLASVSADKSVRLWCVDSKEQR